MSIKKILSGVLAVAMLLTTMGTVAFAEGDAADVWDGTVDDTWYNAEAPESAYTLTTAEQLAGLASLVNAGTSFSGKTITLGADMDLAGLEWTPIGKMDYNQKKAYAFSGKFDGNAKKISNLKIDRKAYSDIGLFGYTTNGEIKNFTLENADVKGYLDVGAVAGTPYTSRYTDILVTGTIKVNGFAYVGGALGKNAYANITNVDVIGDADSSVVADSKNYRTYLGGLVGFMGEGNITIKDCDVAIDVIGSTCDVGGISGNLHYGNKMENCTYTGSLALTATAKEDAAEIGGLVGVVLTHASHTTYIKDSEATVESASVTIDGVTTDVMETLTPHGRFYSTANETNGLMNIENTVVNGEKIEFTNAAAKIGDAKYTSLKGAAAAAKDKDVIEVLRDIKGEGAITVSKSVRITTAVPVSSGGVVLQEVDPAAVDKATISDTSITTDGRIDLTVDNLKFTGDSYINAGGAQTLTVTNCDADVTPSKVGTNESASFIVTGTDESADGLKLDVKDNTIVTPGDSAAIYGYNYISDESVISNNVFGSEEAPLNNTAVKLMNMTEGASIEISDNTVYGEDTGNGFSAFDINQKESKDNVYELLIDNNAVVNTDPNYTGTEFYAVNIESEENGYNNGKVNITTNNTINGSAVNFENVAVGNNINQYVGMNVETNAEGKLTGGTFNTLAQTVPIATGYTTIHTAAGETVVVEGEGEEAIAKEVSVIFEETNNERVYDIYVVSEQGKYINRLMSTQLKFVMADGTVGYVVEPADKVGMTIADGVYEFNFDGINNPSATDVKIKIGTVTFEGYGEADFSIDAEYAGSKVNTAKSDNNIVNTYVPNPAEGEGKLVLDDKIVTTFEPAKEMLTINVTFPNKADDQAAVYQDMKVTISGGDLPEALVYSLGSDDAEGIVPMMDGSYSIAAELTQNTSYTVKVEGAGYRTARYTVNMSGEKVLTFWNNVMDNAQVIETGKDASAVTKNFLAGDIVKDNKINIYDLSAVVSYFGSANDVTAASDYAKYDLNRDGVIDSKDVAYVLVSWDE